jgi:NitT/TauT family transport system permease protein
MATILPLPTARAVTDVRLQDKKAIYRIAFLLTALLIWWLASAFVAKGIVPTIGVTMGVLWDLVTGPDLYHNLWLTSQRVLSGFAFAYVAAMALGIAMGRSKRAEAFFEMFIVIGTSQPGLFVAMIILVALGLKTSTAIFTLAFLATPIITISVWQGAKNLDAGFNELAQVFGYSRTAKIRHVVMPQLIGPALAGMRQGLGITWKYVVMIEMIGLNDGVGYQVTRSFQLFDLASVVAWTICFLTFVLCIEYLVIRTAERRLFRWRDKPTSRVKAPVQQPRVEEPAHV